MANHAVFKICPHVVTSPAMTVSVVTSARGIALAASRSRSASSSSPVCHPTECIRLSASR